MNGHYDLVTYIAKREKNPSSDIPEEHLIDSQGSDNECSDGYEYDDLESDQTQTVECSDNDNAADLSYNIYGPQQWDDVVPIQVAIVPYDLDGRCTYKIQARTRNELLEKCTDGRRWKKDSCTNWNNYESKVRYRDCKGSLRCPRLECEYKQEYGYVNRLKFSRDQVYLKVQFMKKAKCKH